MNQVSNNQKLEPPRDKTAIAFRLSVPLTNWCTDVARKQGISRNEFMESIIHAIRTIVKASEDWQRDGLDPASAMDVIGPACVEEIVRLGLGNQFMADSLEHYKSQQRAALIEARKDKSIRKGR